MTHLANRNVSLGNVLGGFLSDAQSDPQLLEMIQQSIDAYGMSPKMADDLAAGCGKDPQLLKMLPESTLMQLLPASKGSQFFETYYDALQAKPASATAHEVMMDQISDYVNSVMDGSENLDFAPSVMYSMLTALNPADFKELMQQMESNGKLSTLMDLLATSKGQGAEQDMGTILSIFLDHAQNDPEVLQLLEEVLQQPNVQNEAEYFMAHTDAQSLSILSHDTLMMLMEKLEGKPGWATAYDALAIQESTAP